jgi:hypothetical protein
LQSALDWLTDTIFYFHIKYKSSNVFLFTLISFQLLFVIFSELVNHVCQTDFMFDLFDFFWKFHRLFLHRFKEICSTFTIWYFLVYMVISEYSSRYHDFHLVFAWNLLRVCLWSLKRIKSPIELDVKLKLVVWSIPKHYSDTESCIALNCPLVLDHGTGFAF